MKTDGKSRSGPKETAGAVVKTTPALGSLFEFLNDRIWRWFLLQSCSSWSYLRVDNDI